MDELAPQAGGENYKGLAKFFRAVLFSQLTESLGIFPIPMRWAHWKEIQNLFTTNRKMYM